MLYLTFEISISYIPLVNSFQYSVNIARGTLLDAMDTNSGIILFLTISFSGNICYICKPYYVLNTLFSTSVNGYFSESNSITLFTYNFFFTSFVIYTVSFFPFYNTLVSCTGYGYIYYFLSTVSLFIRLGKSPCLAVIISSVASTLVFREAHKHLILFYDKTFSTNCRLVVFFTDIILVFNFINNDAWFVPSCYSIYIHSVTNPIMSVMLY